MEQLFGLVNTLLQDHPDTRKRHLCVRTYKVESVCFFLWKSSLLYMFLYIKYLEPQEVPDLLWNATHAYYLTTGRSIHTKCWSAGVGWWNHTFGRISAWQVCFLCNFRRFYAGYFEVFYFHVVSIFDINMPISLQFTIRRCPSSVRRQWLVIHAMPGAHVGCK